MPDKAHNPTEKGAQGSRVRLTGRTPLPPEGGGEGVRSTGPTGLAPGELPPGWIDEKLGALVIPQELILSFTWVPPWGHLSGYWEIEAASTLSDRDNQMKVRTNAYWKLSK